MSRTSIVRLFAQLWLLLVSGQAVMAQNIALNKTATPTSSQGGFPAAQVNDGNDNTRWGSEYDAKLTTIPPDSNSIYLDFNGIATITQVYLHWETALGKNFKLEVSNDAQSWTGILKVTGNTSATNTLNVNATGRYLRMHGLQRGTQYGYSLWEFQVTGTIAPLPLPVQLVSFTAQRQPAGVSLGWTTASELNNKGFEVQRSLDGQEFTPLGFVAGSGSSASAHGYRYQDAAPLATAAYYRLRQVDQDGTGTYSPTVAVAAGAGNPVAFSTFPNPAVAGVASITWQAAAPHTASWQLLNSLGQVVRAGTVPGEAGPNIQPLDLRACAPGSYLLTLAMAGQPVQRTRLQVQ